MRKYNKIHFNFVETSENFYWKDHIVNNQDKKNGGTTRAGLQSFLREGVTIK